MGSIALVIAILGGLAGLTGLVAVARAQVVGAKDQANLRSMERAVESRDAEIAGLRLDVARHERTIAAHEVKMAAQDVTIEHQAEQITTLEAERPSADEIAYIKRRLDAHDQTVQEFMAKWERQMNGGDS
jgi:small-conductance mechanosensitive channel